MCFTSIYIYNYYYVTKKNAYEELIKQNQKKKNGLFIKTVIFKKILV